MPNEWAVVAEQPLSEWAVVSQTPAVDGGKFSRDLAAKGLPALNRPNIPALAPRQEPTPQEVLASPMQAAFAIEQQRQADESQAVEDYETGALAEAAQGAGKVRDGKTIDERAGGAAQAIRGGLKAAAPAMIAAGPSAVIAGGVPMLKGLAADAAAGYVAGKVGKSAAKALGAGEGVQDLTEEALGLAVTAPRAVKRVLGAEAPAATPQQRFLEAQRKAKQAADAQRIEGTDWAVISREPAVPQVEAAPLSAEIAVPAAKAARKPRQRKPKAEPQTPESQIAANEARMAEIQKQLEAQQPAVDNQNAEGAPPVSVVETVRATEPGPEIPVSMRQLRSASPLKGEEFDREMLAAADRGEVQLTTHDHGGALTPEQRAELGLVQDPENGKWYTAATRPEEPAPVSPGSMSGRPVSEARKQTQTGAAIIPAKEVAEKLASAKTAMVDRFAPIEDLEKIATDEIAAEMSPYKAARSFGGHQGIVANRLNQLRQIFRPAKKEGYLDDAIELGMLERHEELGARLPGYSNPDGLTQQQVSAARQALEQQIAQGGKGQQSAKLLSDWRAYNDNLMQELKDGGIISQESLDAIRKGNEKYIPFNRVEYLQKELDSDTIPQGSNAFNVASQNVVHRIEGSDKEIADPILSTVRNTMRVTKLVERNNVVRRVAALAARPEFQATVIPMKPNQKVIPAGFEPVSYLQDGIKQQILVPTGVAESLKQLNEQQADFLTKAVTTFGSMLRAGVTLDPVFMARNVARDFQTASVNNRLGGVIGFTPADWVRGFAGALGRGNSNQRIPFLNDKLYREFLDSKGAFGGFYHRGNLKETTAGLTEPTGVTIAKTVLNPVELMKTIGETFELAPRLGVFSKARKQGLSPTEAGWKARNATVDFERRGTAMRVINMAVPFLNARMQGTLNLYGAIREAPLTTMSRLTMVAGAPFLAMYAWNNKHFPKLYDEVSDREKENNYVFIYGDKRDDEGNLTQAIKIPKGEVSPYVNALENFLEWYRGKDAKGWQQVVTQFASDSSPVPFAREGKFSFRETRSAVLPPPLKAAEEIGTNKNVYTGRDIVPPYLQKASPQEQYTSRTPDYMVKASEALGKVGVDVSPMMIQNVLGTQFGYLGRRVADVKNIPATMGKSFKGAYATSKDSQRMQRLGDIQRTEADRDVVVSREARRMFDRVSKNKTRDEFRAAFTEADSVIGSKLDPDGKMNPERRQQLRQKLLAEFADVIEMRAKDMSPFERQLGSASAETRAQMVLQELKSVQGEERRKLFQNWQQKKLITPRVMEKMAELLATQ